MMFEEALKDHLEGLGLVDSDSAEPDWFVGMMQDGDGSDFAVAVLPEAGTAPTRTLGDFPSITIRVRHPKGQEANEFLRQVYLELQEFSSTDLAGSGIGLARIRASQGPVQIGRDGGDEGMGRWIVQQTFAAIVPRY